MGKSLVEWDDTKIVSQQFCKEVILWNSLSHPNVLKFVGVLGGIDQYQFATVSEWMAHGNIMEYIKKNAANRLKFVGISSFRAQYSLYDPFLTSIIVAWCGARAGISS